MADEETIIELEKEIRPILERVAHNRTLISYGELASEVGSRAFTITHIDSAPQHVGVGHRAWMR